MIANYGFEDGTGVYYISIDTEKCAGCEWKSCVEGCPEGLFQCELDDWDDEVIVVPGDKRNILRQACENCKSAGGRASRLPCQEACALDAINHSW